jgi:hypothetical protein
MGEILPETSDYCQLIVENYRLIYRNDKANKRVIIIGAIHAARDLPPIMQSRIP